MLGEARRGSLIPSGEKSGIWVQETRGIIRKRLAVSSEKFCVGVSDPRHEPKSSVAQRRHMVIT